MVHVNVHRKLARIQRDPLLTARAAGLRYVLDTTPGLQRKKRGKHFFYVDPEGKTVRDPEVLDRIKKMVLPPAWRDVWICPHPNGHLQATGVDAMGRKQYRYHADWNQVRSHTKYFRLPQFAEALPVIRERVDKDLKLPGISFQKVLALAVSILEQTNIRIGNQAYKKLYGSFGLTTLQDKHVQIEGKQIQFQFKGKKGVSHTVQLKSPRLARLIQRCKDIPGKELFQYLDEQGHHHSIGSGDVNQYLKEITGTDFTAKDFRTWAGTITAFRMLREMDPPASEAEAKRNIVQAIDAVCLSLGNTRTVCKKYYIHPAILDAYENGTFFSYLDEMPETADEKEWITPDEKKIKEILQDYRY
jgi:DNA topoisomerase-1